MGSVPLFYAIGRRRPCARGLSLLPAATARDHKTCPLPRGGPMDRRTACLAVLSLAALAGARLPRAAAEEPAPPVQVTVDVSDAPDAKDWAEKAKALAEKWYPVIAEELKTDGFTPPRRVKLVFKDEKQG